MAELPILVVAGNYQEFIHWCRENNIHPRQGTARFVRDWNDLRGRRGCRYVTYGTFYSRRDMVEIYDALKAIEAVPWEESADA